MTRFLPLTRGGWPAEVLASDLTGRLPLAVKHCQPDGTVLIHCHRQDGRAFLSEESKFDLIPAPEPSEAALKAAVEAIRRLRGEPTCGTEDALKAGLRAAYGIDGITPQQQPDRVAELEAEVARLTKALAAKAERFDETDGLNGAACAAVRDLLNAHDVPCATFIDDHVANAIFQRNQAREEVERLTAELDRYRNWVPSASAVTEANIKARSIKDLLTIAFRHDFPDPQLGTGEQA